MQHTIVGLCEYQSAGMLMETKKQKHKFGAVILRLVNWITIIGGMYIV